MKRLLFAMLLALPTLTAQIVTADNCVHQAGDNPAWARPDFDDSEWSKQFPAIGSPYVWTRCRLDMKSLPRTGPIHVGVETLAAWEVFLNGEPAGSSGNIRTGFASMETKQHRPIPPAVANQESISVALRQLPGRAKPNPRPATISAGNKDTLIVFSTTQFSARLRQIWPSLLGGAFSLAIGIAGHPSPYCDGREVEVEAGLPLGITPGVQYAESIMRGERFTLVSDGVVEAENGQRELFGFDRTREISGRSAQEIAQAAQAWGQNDDITVVTVRRSA